MSVSTLADQVEWATDLLRPLRDVAVEQVLDAYVMHLDSTGLPVLDRQGPKGKRIGSLLGLVGDVAAVLYTSTGKKPRRARPRGHLDLTHGASGA